MVEGSVQPQRASKERRIEELLLPTLSHGVDVVAASPSLLTPGCGRTWKFIERRPINGTGILLPERHHLGGRVREGRTERS